MSRRSGVTIEDVAAIVGVSRQTVSRVLNGSENVKPAVRQSVQAAIESLGYVPNLSARRMGGGRSFLILAVNDRARTIENWRAGRGNDWVDQMLNGGMTECERHGYYMAFELIDTDPAAARKALTRALGALRPDGVILTPPHSDNDDLVEVLAAWGTPCARIGRREGGATVDVYMDEEGAAREATLRLTALGHRRIAFIAGMPNYGASPRRILGFRAALAEAGLDDSAGPVRHCDFNFAKAAEALDALLSEADRPTAVIAENDEMAFAVLHTAHHRGLRAPDDLSIVSFEDTPGVRFSVPPLSAIRQPTAEMIAKACERLIAIVGGAEAEGAYPAPYSFISRASTGPAR